MRWIGIICLLLCRLVWAQEFLDPAVAFKPSVQVLSPEAIEVRFEIAKGYYLYRDKFRFTVEADAVTLLPPEFPPGKMKNDDSFGKVEVYYRSVAIKIPVSRQASGELPLRLNVLSQGCADAGVCYPPQQQTLSLVLPMWSEVPTGAASSLPPAGSGDESAAIAAALAGTGFWANLGLFFVAGLGLSLTPCVFPMIPILSGIIAGQSGESTPRGRSFLLSVAYVLGMALTYTLMGVAAGLTGTLLSAALQNAWVLGAFALIFVALAGAMFGFYELQLPSSWQSTLSGSSSQLVGGKLAGVFGMGALSALIVGPCVAAPLAGALLYIGQTGDAVLGGLALFTLSLGMGTPLLLIGLSAGRVLPRAGRWMNAVKQGFGVMLLATAIWLVSPVLPEVVSMLAWGVLAILTAMYLQALEPLPANAHGITRFWKGIGILLLLYGAAVFIGALAGQRDPLQPLKGLGGARAENAVAATHLPFEPVRSLAELDARLAATDRPVMLDFYADWCVSCKEMERFTFSDPQVKARLAGVLLLQADVTANRPEDKALLKRFGLYGPPGIIFFNAQGQEIQGHRVVGYQDAARFLTSLEALR